MTTTNLLLVIVIQLAIISLQMAVLLHMKGRG